MQKRIPLLAAAGLAVALLLYLAARLDPASSAAAEVPVAAQAVPASPRVVIAPGSSAELPREEAQGAQPATEQEAADKVELLISDPDGAPVSGATVETFDDSVPAVQVTDAGGRCSMSFELEGPSFRVHVTREGYHHIVGELEREAEKRLTLYPSGLLEGRVTDLDDRPIAGAAVRINETDCEQCGRLSALSDALGRFELAVPRGRNTQVEALADGFVPKRRSFELRDESGLLELHLDRGLDLWFEIVDLETDRPIAGAKLKRGIGNATADETGRVRSRTLLGAGEDEAVRIGVSAEGYCDMTVTHDPVGARPGEVVTVRMVRDAAVEGLVVDASGAPVEGAWISVRRDYRSLRSHVEGAGPLEGLDTSALLSALGRRRVVSEAQGHYLVEGLAPWEPRCRLTFGSAGFKSHTETPVLGEPGSTLRLDVNLRALLEGGSGRLLGTLRVAGTPSSGQLHWRGASSSGSASFEDDGTFEVEQVETGVVRVTLTPSLLDDWDEEDCGPLPPLEHTVQVSAGEAARLDVDMPLEVAAISGVVVDSAGAPVPKVEVWANSVDSYCAIAWGETDEEGRFELTVLQRFAAYEVGAWRRPQQVSLGGVAPGSEDLELMLPDVGVLEYRALARDTGRPLVGARLLLRKAGDAKYERHRFSGSPDPEGWYRLEVEAGVLDVRIDPDRMPDYFPAHVEGVRVGAEPVEVELYLERALSLDLVRAAGQAPWPEGSAVLLLPEGTRDEVSVVQPSNPRSWWFGPKIREREAEPGRHWSVSFGERGRVRVRRLRPGRYRLEAFPEPIGFEPQVIDVRAGMDPVTVRWSED